MINRRRVAALLLSLLLAIAVAAGLPSVFGSHVRLTENLVELLSDRHGPATVKPDSSHLDGLAPPHELAILGGDCHLVAPSNDSLLEFLPLWFPDVQASTQDLPQARAPPA